MIESNAIYIGQTLRVCLGGSDKRNLYDLKGMSGYAEQTLDGMLFIPEDARPAPENLEDSEILRNYYRDVELTVKENLRLAELMESCTYRVRASDILWL